MLIVPERDITDLMTRETAFGAVEKAFAAMASGDARNFPVVREAIGHEDALYGFKGGFDRAGQALGLKAGGYWPRNDTGKPSAMVGGNLLTALRTAAASAVSIKHLARPDSKVLGVVGAGRQAPFQLRAALDQRPFEKVVAWNRHPERIPDIGKVADGAGIPLEEVGLAGMAEADVIITVTSSFAPSLMAGHVSEGTHLACMGTDTEGKQEVDPAILARASVFTDEVAQSVSIGEAQHAVAAGLVKEAEIVGIGAVINGAAPGRTSEAQVTLFDGTGVGLQDLAVAAAVVEAAAGRGLAVEVDF